MKKVLLVPVILISSLLMVVSCAKGNNTQSVQSGTTSSLASARHSLAKYLSWIKTMTEDDIEKVTYVAQTHNAQTDCSFWDYKTTYVSSSREDLTKTISFLRTSQIEISKYEILYPEEREKASVTFTVTLKNGKDLVIYGTDAHLFDNVYFDDELVKTNDYSSFGLLPHQFFSIPLPVMSNKVGYNFQDCSFNNCIIRNQEKAETIYNTRVSKLMDTVFADDTFEVSSEYNNYNRYTICNDYDSSVIIFESSKQFRIFAGIGVNSEIGRYRITNDVSFEDLSIQ